MKVKILRNVSIAVAMSMLFINVPGKAAVKVNSTSGAKPVQQEANQLMLVPEGPIVVVIPRVVMPMFGIK